MSEYIIKLANADCMVGSPFDTPYLREEIVRCRDCERFDGEHEGCRRFSHYVDPDGFCAWAERRAD